MKKNMGVVDRIVRLLLAAGIVALLAMKIVVGVWAVVLGVLALIFVVTAAIAFCPLYEPFGIKTFKVVNPAEVASTQMFDVDGDTPAKPKS